ncbi:MAG: T9SS type A sorting domain-containing protein [Saprospiraceae bacterium]|nr:T9SS type A sorting domain-containing protein [Candidatus Vicinibacter proximus]
MYKFFLAIAFNLFLIDLYSQKYDFNWIMGEPYAIKKDSLEGTAILNFNSQNGNPLIQASPKFKNYMGSYGALISDKDGNFMFQFNGYRLEDYTNKWVTGDEDICPINYCGYHPQSCLIIPNHNNKLIFNLINTETFAVGDTNAYLLCLNLFVNKLSNTINNSGLILQKIRNQIVNDSIDFERLTACRHANGKDWWIIVGRFNRNEVYSFLFNGENIDTTFIQNIGRIPGNSSNGYSCFSPDGNYYCITLGENLDSLAIGGVEFYNFDRCSGLISNRQYVLIDTTPTIAFGCAFSPDSRFLYLSSSYYLYQYEIINGKLSNKQVIAEYDGHYGHIFQNNRSSSTFGNLQLAPDGRIYSNPEFLQSRYMHVINEPNKPGSDCDFRQHSVRLKSIITTIPSFPNFRLGPIDGSICDSLGIDNIPWCWWRYEQDTSRSLCIKFRDLSAYEVSEWFWDFGDGVQSTDTSPVHCYSKGGVYDVCLIVKNHNGADTLCRSLNLGTTHTSGDNNLKMQIEIFPNPANNYVVINLIDYIPQRLVCTLFNSQGEKVLSQRIFQGSNTIDLESIPSGLYFVQLGDINGMMKTEKLVIE